MIIKYLRFSLRSLVFATAISAILIYYLFLPRMNANRFVRAVKNGEIATAIKMLDGADSKDGHISAITNMNSMTIEPLTVASMLRGETYVFVNRPKELVPFMVGGQTWFCFHRNGVKTSTTTMVL